MLTAETLKAIQIEISSNCNAGCLECARWVNEESKQQLNPKLNFGHKGNFPIELFRNIFQADKLKSLGGLFFDGNYGDSLIHPDALLFMEHMNKEFFTNRNFIIEVNSNGGYKDTTFWYEMGKLFAEMYRLSDDERESSVVFGLDGIDNETHGIYRRNVVYDKVVENAQAFIKGGGKAEWKYLEFNHNSHQVEQARETAKKLGFEKFFVKSTRWKEAAHRTIEGNKSDQIRASATKKSKAVVIDRIPDSKKAIVEKVRKEMASYKDYYNEVPVSCYWNFRKRVQREYDGLVWQCCHLSGVYGSSAGFSKKDYQYYVDKFGTTWNNLHENSLDAILTHEYFNALEDSLSNKMTDTVNPRIKRCVEKCAQSDISQHQFFRLNNQHKDKLNDGNNPDVK